MYSTTQKIGILGGGQLGKMLCLAAAPLDFKTFILEHHKDCPAGQVCTGLTIGDFKSYDDVMAFGRNMDIITIEIENVNTDALKVLEAEGKIIHPAPRALEIIKDKGLQKQFYTDHNLPTTPFQLFDNEGDVRNAIDNGVISLPFVQKSRTAGYDGKGVAVIRNQGDLQSKLLPGPCVVENLADIHLEIAVIAARNANDEVTVFPAVEMEFHSEANLVEFLVCPARISPLVEAEAEALAESVIRAFDICGLLAVELFLLNNGELLINEVAPRPHNSGHHTIDSAVTNQFQQHLRAICNLPLGDTTQVRPAVMLNVLGEPGFNGPVRYEGAEECLAIPGVYLHLYGKAITSPFRKMGHIAVTGETVTAAVEKANRVKALFKVVC
jgi:5-(carboxyamino)imidazole ribonucleotide synthase